MYFEKSYVLIPGIRRVNLAQKEKLYQEKNTANYLGKKDFYTT